jgi:hypothetical protein
MMVTLMSQRGSVLLESTGTLLALSLFLTGGFLILYLAFARVWLDRHVYEAVVCLSSTARERDCEQALRKRVLFALPIGQLKNVQLSRTRDQATVRLSFWILDQRTMEFEEQRRLPLFSGTIR